MKNALTMDDGSLYFHQREMQGLIILNININHLLVVRETGKGERPGTSPVRYRGAAQYPPGGTLAGWARYEKRPRTATGGSVSFSVEGGIFSLWPGGT